MIEVDANSPIGKTDAAGVKDLVLESALTTIQVQRNDRYQRLDESA